MFKNFFKKIYQYFSKLENHIRTYLTRHPLLYSLIGGIAIVLFWRGVWVTADTIPLLNHGLVSVAVSIVLLIATGLLASFFMGDIVLMSSVKEEEKMIRKTEGEVRVEENVLMGIQKELKNIENEINHIQAEVEANKSEKVEENK